MKNKHMEITWHSIKEEGLPKQNGKYLFYCDGGDMFGWHYQVGNDEGFTYVTHWAEIPLPEKPKSELARKKCYHSPCEGCPLTEYCNKSTLEFDSLLDYVRFMVKGGKEILKKYGESEE